MIKIANTEDFGFVCNCAVRYCLMRRRTYAPMWAEFLTAIEQERKRRKNDENA